MTSSTKIDFAGYCHSICQTYKRWQEGYVAQDAQSHEPENARSENVLFADLVVGTWQKKRDNTIDNNNESEINKSQPEKFKVLDGLRKYASNHVLLIGKPGSGKTTAIQRLLVEEAQRKSALPILIELRGYRNSIFDLAFEFVESHRLGFQPNTLKEALSQGRCLLLIDGLNELPSEAAKADLIRFLKAYRSNSIVASTRDLGLGGDFGIKEKLILQPLTQNQIQAFIRAYLPEEKQVETMLSQLRPKLQDFKETPMLLLMLCEVFMESQQLPENLGMAFRQFTKRYDAYFKPEIQKMAYSREVMSHLAFKMMQGSDRLSPLLAIPEHEAIQILSERCQEGDRFKWAQDWLVFLQRYHLLQRRSDGQIEFIHQLWQEYYAAEYLVGYLPELSDEQLKNNFINCLKWTESLKLLFSFLEHQSQALRLVNLGLSIDIFLGAKLAGSTREKHQPKAINQLVAYDIPFNRDQFRGLIPGIKQHHKPFFLHLLLSKTQSGFAVSSLQDSLRNKSLAIRRSAIKALQMIGNEQAAVALTELINSWDLPKSKKRHRDMYRYTIKSLGDTRCEAAVQTLFGILNDQDFYTRKEAVEALGKIGNVSAVQALVKTFNKNSSPHTSYLALSEICKIDNSYARKALSQVLERKGKEHPIVAIALAKSGHQKAVSILKEILDNGRGIHEKLRAALTLSKLGDEKAISFLIEVLRDKSFDKPYDTTALSATTVLGEIGTTRTLAGLIDVVEDCDSPMKSRQLALMRLSEHKGEQVTQSLSRVFNDESEKNLPLKQKAAYALAHTGLDQAIKLITCDLNNKKPSIRLQAAHTLFELGNQKATDVLITTLQDKTGQGVGDSWRDQKVRKRFRAAEALMTINNGQAAIFFLEQLSGAYRRERKRAAENLAKIGNPSHIEKLWQQQLQVVSNDQTDDFSESIEAIQNHCQFYNYNVHRQAIPALPLPLFIKPVPPIKTSNLSTNFKGASIGAVNINSIVYGNQAGTQINKTQ